MNEQMQLDDRLDKFKSWNSAQMQKERADLMRDYFKLPDSLSNKQILAKEKQLRKTYQKEVGKKESEIGFVMGNIADAMMQQAFYGGDQGGGWGQSDDGNNTKSQQHMAKVLAAVEAKEKRNNAEIKKYLVEAKVSAVKKVFGEV